MSVGYWFFPKENHHLYIDECRLRNVSVMLLTCVLKPSLGGPVIFNCLHLFVLRHIKMACRGLQRGICWQWMARTQNKKKVTFVSLFFPNNWINPHLSYSLKSKCTPKKCVVTSWPCGWGKLKNFGQETCLEEVGHREWDFRSYSLAYTFSLSFISWFNLIWGKLATCSHLCSHYVLPIRMNGSLQTMSQK